MGYSQFQDVVGKEMSKYPVGATWEGEEIDVRGTLHRKALIKLNNRGKAPWYDEIWYWSWTYSDGSTEVYHYDWCTSYAMCKKSIPFACRMRRVN
jgi:hypothetical protein